MCSTVLSHRRWGICCSGPAGFANVRREHWEGREAGGVRIANRVRASSTVPSIGATYDTEPPVRRLRPVLVGGSELQGVVHRFLDAHEDERGTFTEVYADHWTTGIEPRQWSLVHSVTGALRGMHLHRRHAEYVSVVRGRLSVGLYDARPGAPTEGRWARYDLADDTPSFLTFPAGFVHGWLAHEPTTHLQAVSEPYVDYAEDDNLGCHWADPALGIEWPFAPTVVAPPAASFPSLDELLSRV